MGRPRIAANRLARSRFGLGCAWTLPFPPRDRDRFAHGNQLRLQIARKFRRITSIYPIERYRQAIADCVRRVYVGAGRGFKPIIHTRRGKTTSPGKLSLAHL
jgi:hypothetical protein